MQKYILELGFGFEIFKFLDGNGRKHKNNGNDGGGAQCRREAEDAGYADCIGQKRGGHERDGKTRADGGTHKSHGSGEKFLSNTIGNHRGDGGRDGARPLHGPRKEKHFDAVGRSGKKTARNKEHESEGDHGLAAEFIAGRTERNLQKGLCEAVDSERQTDHEGIVAALEALRPD